MGKILSRIVNGVKENYRHYKVGKKMADQEYQRLQRIKGTPENFRTKADTDYANTMNKTKVKPNKYNQ